MMRALFVALVLLTAAVVVSGYEIVSSVKLKASNSDFSKLEGRRFERQ